MSEPSRKRPIDASSAGRNSENWKSVLVEIFDYLFGHNNLRPSGEPSALAATYRVGTHMMCPFNIHALTDLYRARPDLYLKFVDCAPSDMPRAIGPRPDPALESRGPQYMMERLRYIHESPCCGMSQSHRFSMTSLRQHCEARTRTLLERREARAVKQHGGEPDVGLIDCGANDDYVASSEELLHRELLRYFSSGTRISDGQHKRAKGQDSSSGAEELEATARAHASTSAAGSSAAPCFSSLPGAVDAGASAGDAHGHPNNAISGELDERRRATSCDAGEGAGSSEASSDELAPWEAPSAEALKLAAAAAMQEAEAERLQLHQGVSGPGKTGYIGVVPHHRGPLRFEAILPAKYTSDPTAPPKSLGRFATKEEAALAFARARRESPQRGGAHNLPLHAPPAAVLPPNAAPPPARCSSPGTSGRTSRAPGSAPSAPRAAGTSCGSPPV